MTIHIEDNEFFSLEDLIDTIITEKIFNIDNDEILSRLSKALKHKIDSLYKDPAPNLFIRASLANSTYKPQQIVISTQSSTTSNGFSFHHKQRITHRPTILNWFKRDLTKYPENEKNSVKKECVGENRMVDESTGVTPLDVDPLGTLMISGDMISFSSDTESELYSEYDPDEDIENYSQDVDTGNNNNELSCLTTSSIPNDEFVPVDEDDETCLYTNSLNNLSTDRFGSETSRSYYTLSFNESINESLDCEMSDNYDKGIDNRNKDSLPLDIDNTNTDCNLDPVSYCKNTNSETESTYTNNKNVELYNNSNNNTNNSDNTNNDCNNTNSNNNINSSNYNNDSQNNYNSVHVNNNTTVKFESDFHLGNNLFIFYGMGNNTIATYWVLTKVFNCDFKTLVNTTDSVEHDFVLAQNRKIQQVDCKILHQSLENELVSLIKLKEILLSRHSSVCILDFFDQLPKEKQILFNKWFNTLHEKVFILVCNKLNQIDTRVKSFSLMFRVSAIDEDKFIDCLHKKCMKAAKKNSKNCLSRLNVIEIAKRVNHDILLSYNTVSDATKNYFNAIRKHKLRYGHRYIRSLIHILIQGKRSDIIDNAINKLVNDIFYDYGQYELDIMLYDFYLRLLEIGKLDVEPLKFEINNLIANVYTYKNLHLEMDEELNDFKAKMKCMVNLVYDIMDLIKDNK